MKKIISSSLVLGLLALLFPSTAHSADVMKPFVLLGFSGTNVEMSTAQISRLETKLKSYPLTQEAFCVGLVYKQANSQTDVALAKNRATQVCNFIKSKNPDLVTYASTTTTPYNKERNQVEIQFRWNTSLPVTGPTAETDPISWQMSPIFQVGKPCGSKFDWQILGLDANGNPAYIRCSGYREGIYVLDRNMPKIDPESRRPIVSKTVPAKTYFGYSPNLYISPTIDKTNPRTQISTGSFSDTSKCKIAEINDGDSGKSFGFPLPSSRSKLKENFKILVIPVQFEDHTTQNKPADDMADVISALTNFYVRASSVPISFDWTIPDEYFPLGKTIDSYGLNYEFDGSAGKWWPSYKNYLQEVVNRVDDSYDFSKFDAVIIEEPRSVTDKEHGMFIPNAPEKADGYDAILSDEGYLKSLMVTGGDEQRDIANWIHEFGHLLGLGDRNWNIKTSPGFDIMFGFYGAPELSVWNRWLLGILQDKQVDCKVDKLSSIHLIRPVAWVGDYKKAVVIPVSKNVVLVAESRRRQGYDALLGKESEGVYVYRVDTSGKMYQRDSRRIVDVVKPARSKTKSSFSLDAALDPGEKVASDGWQIEVLESGGFGDVIRVTKR